MRMNNKKGGTTPKPTKDGKSGKYVPPSPKPLKEHREPTPHPQKPIKPKPGGKQAQDEIQIAYE